jgi:sulfite exporter TauE/SafE
MIEALDFLGFLVLGLLGGFGHCVGMCSPFVLFVSRHYAHPANRHGGLVPQLWYTTGRVAAYAVLGSAAGAVGGAAELGGALLGLQRAAAILAGAVLVIWAVVALSDLVPGLGGGGVLGTRWFARLPGGLRKRVPGHPLAAGLFLGLLPCGLLYSALIAAVALGGPLKGGAALAIFGLGTAPALLGVAFADRLLASRAAVNRASQVFLFVMGSWFLWTALA